MFRVRLALIITGLVLAGCAAMPAQGPSTASILATDRAEANFPYAIVDLDDRAVLELRRRAAPSFASFAAYRPTSEPPIAVGDVVRVHIWEAAPGGLFTVSLSGGAAVTGAQGTAIPEQVVPRAGTITVPFAGAIRVSGQSPRDVERAIVRRLSLKAVEPQVMVSVVRSSANTVTITGDAIAGAQVPLTPQGQRLLEVIALAGGIKAAEHETFVSLTRNGRLITVPFSTITAQSEENIRLGPGDILVANRRPRSVTIFGATGKNTEIPFEASSLSLAQALARAGGLLDSRADAAGVFVFRFENAQDLARIFPEHGFQTGALETPVVYRLNLREATGMFLAQSFPVREGDMIYVANATASEVQKFLSILQTVVQPTMTGVRAYDMIH